MNVCFLYPHIFGHGGYPRDIYRIMNDLTYQGQHKITTCPPSKDVAIKGKLLIDELTLMPHLKKALKEADVIHIFGTFFPLYPILAKMIKNAGVPYVISPLTQLEPNGLMKGQLKKSLALTLGGKWMFANAAAIHSFSESETQSIKALVPNANIKEASLGIYYEDIPEKINPSTLRPNKDYFLFFGRLSYYHKGIDILLDAYATYLENGGTTDLVIAGRAWKGSDTLIIERVSSLNILNKVHFLGEVSSHEKYALINECKAFIYPSRIDGPPRPIREALALKKPLLISDQSNMITDIEGYGWGYAYDANPEALSSAMMRMDKEYSEDHYEDPSNVLSWKHITKQYAKIYDQINLK